MTKVIFYVSLIGMVLTLTQRGVPSVFPMLQDFYAGETIRIVAGFPAGGGVNSVI